MTDWVQEYATWHTKQLMDERQEVMRDIRCGIGESAEDLEFRRKALYAELNTREHVPSKTEAKAIRKAKQQAKQHR